MKTYFKHFLFNLGILIFFSSQVSADIDFKVKCTIENFEGVVHEVVLGENADPPLGSYTYSILKRVNESSNHPYSIRVTLEKDYIPFRDFLLIEIYRGLQDFSTRNNNAYLVARSKVLIKPEIEVLLESPASDLKVVCQRGRK
jgi:hypothetical protein